MFSFRAFIWIAFFAVPLPAQIALQNPQDISLVDRLISGEDEGQKLNCHVQTYRPFLDFSFRFEAGYVVRCPLGQFEGKETTIASYTRVSPIRGAPLTLGGRFQIPAIPQARRSDFNWKRFHDEAEFSGVFATGEGE